MGGGGKEERKRERERDLFNLTTKYKSSPDQNYLQLTNLTQKLKLVFARKTHQGKWRKYEMKHKRLFFIAG